ncbi:hypothetical protein OH77DRAFT_113174 [Trametes cingulata]|nr:hypothetical protein OH77DRAFT_113174 [Trametes cingulata]
MNGATKQIRINIHPPVLSLSSFGSSGTKYAFCPRRHTQQQRRVEYLLAIHYLSFSRLAPPARFSLSAAPPLVQTRLSQRQGTTPTLPVQDFHAPRGGIHFANGIRQFSRAPLQPSLFSVRVPPSSRANYRGGRPCLSFVLELFSSSVLPRNVMRLDSGNDSDIELSTVFWRVN